MEAIVPTYSGGKINLADPQPEDINIIDIAVGLSREGRWNNQTRLPVTVAEHCVVGTILIDQENKLPFLLHDASEAYFRDVAGPLKKLPELAGYKKLEKRMQEVIYFKYGITETPALKEMDIRLEGMERSFLMRKPTHESFVDYSALYKLYDEKMIFEIYMNWFKRLTK